MTMAMMTMMLEIIVMIKSSDCAVITQEKTIQNIENFDKKNLKHTETEVKTTLPDKASKC